MPIEVKSGKDYTVHSALNHFVSNDEYTIQEGYVLSNEIKEFNFDISKSVYLFVIRFCVCIFCFSVANLR